MTSKVRRGLLVGAQPGMRVRFMTPGGVKIGTIKTIDETTFPGVVVVVDEAGETHQVPIHIGCEE